MKIEKKILIAGPHLADSQSLTSDLMASLKLATPDISVDRIKPSDETMDLGTIVSIVFASGAATAIGKGIADWLRRQPSAKITIYENDRLVAENITSEDAVRLATIFKK